LNSKPGTGKAHSNHPDAIGSGADVFAWYLPARGASYIELRINRNMLVAVIVSVVLHLLALFILIHHRRTSPPTTAEQPQPISVRLTPRAPVVAEATLPPRSPEPVPEAPSQKVRKPRTEPVPPPAPRTNPIAATQPPALHSPEAPVSLPPPAPVPNPAPATDMLAYVNAARERRRIAEAEAGRINAEAVARERGPSEDEARMANLQRNMQPPGTNGIFQIISKDAHSAQFSFRGWKNDFSYSRREVYQVDVGLNGNIDRAIVRKMIEIIRRYYSGDFNWESPRLGRVVVLSARIEDNDGLEDFMMKEFFITGAP
jgi:outer membrane biosynthesis protein TonB